MFIPYTQYIMVRLEEYFIGIEEATLLNWADITD